MPHKIDNDLLSFVRSTLVKATPNRITEATPLFEQGWIDSINILDLIGFVELALGRRLEDSEIIMSSFRTVGDMKSAFFS